MSCGFLQSCDEYAEFSGSISELECIGKCVQKPSDVFGFACSMFLLFFVVVFMIVGNVCDLKKKPKKKERPVYQQPVSRKINKPAAVHIDFD